MPNHILTQADTWDAIRDMKMAATNALSEVWLADPPLSDEEARKLLIEAMERIQYRGSAMLQWAPSKVTRK
jgi:hypothetical protein